MARIDTLSNFLTDVAGAIRIKTGGTDAIDAADFDTEIDSISAGGTEPTDGDYLVQFIGYRGEVLQSGKYATGDVVSVPADPVYDGLVFDGWSSPVTITDGTVTVTDQDLTIGAMFDTASGKTEIDIVLTNVTGTTVTLDGITGFTLIEWGDGSTSTSLGSHTYDAIGEYTILISGSNMVFSTGSVAVDRDIYPTGIFQQYYDILNYTCVEIRLSSVVSFVESTENDTTTGAFSYCNSLTSITIPSSVTSIGAYAFCYCYSLSSITIPSSITSIGSSVFYNCYSLSSITIPSSATSIGYTVFCGCNSLTSVTIPDSVTSIGSSVFISCNSLTNVAIPSSVTSIGSSVFYTCYSLTSITIPSSVTSVGSYAFYNCHSLTEYDFTAYTSTDTVPTLSATSAFTNINGICKMYFADSATLARFASATNWSTYANYMYVKE